LISWFEIWSEGTHTKHDCVIILTPHPKKSMQKTGTMTLSSNICLIFIKVIHHFAVIGTIKYTNASNKHYVWWVRNLCRLYGKLQNWKMCPCTQGTCMSVCCCTTFTIEYTSVSVYIEFCVIQELPQYSISQWELDCNNSQTKVNTYMLYRYETQLNSYCLYLHPHMDLISWHLLNIYSEFIC